LDDSKVGDAQKTLSKIIATAPTLFSNGRLCDIAVVTGPNVPAGQVTLLDCAGILYSTGGITINVHVNGLFEPDDDPIRGDTSSPITAAAALKDLWQANLLAVEVEELLRWKRMATNSVVTLQIY
jgi:hypothetical protein